MSDFRVLIDVTDSMARHDSENYRKEAVRLIGELVPESSYAGVWTYGRYVEMTTEWGKVDSNWRQLAQSGADKIHASAKLADLNGALKRVSVGWKNPDPDRRRVLLLISDSRVTVSKDHARNEASREALLAARLPALRSAGVSVHSIALGEESDESLLRRLAVETGGSFTRTSDASQLPALVYDVFMRVHQPGMGQLEGSEFKVDAAVRRLSLMLFTTSASEPVVVIPPDSGALSARKTRGARWLQGRNYLLVQIDKPEPGLWRHTAAADARSRLMLESGMRLQTLGVPAFSRPGEAFEISAELFKKNKKIRRNAYLRFVDFEVTHIDPDGNESRYEMQHTEDRKLKGRYLYPVTEALIEGRHRFTISASASTFFRQQRFEVDVRWPVEVRVENAESPGIYRVQVRPREAYVRPDGLVAELELETPDGRRRTLALEENLGGWLQARIETDADGLYRGKIKVVAQTNQDSIIEFNPDDISFLGVYRAPAPVEAEAAADPDAESQGFDRKLVGYIVVGVNATLFLALIVWWLRSRSKNEPDDFEIEAEELGIEPQ